MSEDTHICPVGRCVIRVPSHQLMCRRHWGMVPREVQREVYGAWRGGDGAETDEHIAAMDGAIAAVERRLAER